MSNSTELSSNIKFWGEQLGFSLVRITNADLIANPERMQKFLAQDFHGEMAFLGRNLEARLNPQKLMPEVKSIICCALNYYQPHSSPYISRYALGRDYHQVMRNYLQKFADKILQEVGDVKLRYFVDSSPVAEKDLAVRAGLGWRGRNSLLVTPEYGSWVFLGEIYTSLILTSDQPRPNRCGDCDSCLKACPTQAIIAPCQIDARRCISYLTIEHKSEIDKDLHSLLSGHVYGCDLCQNACPWNHFAKSTTEPDFYPRHNLAEATLSELAAWTEADFLVKTKDSAIRRIGYQRWRHNLKLSYPFF
jgi:epoxyqueuosine reductase